MFVVFLSIFMETNLLTCKQYKGAHCKVEIIKASNVNAFFEINTCKVRWYKWHAQSSAWHTRLLLHMLTPISALVTLLTLLPFIHCAFWMTFQWCVLESFMYKATFLHSSIQRDWNTLLWVDSSSFFLFHMWLGVINVQCISFVSWWLPQRCVR